MRSQGIKGELIVVLAHSIQVNNYQNQHNFLYNCIFKYLVDSKCGLIINNIFYSKIFFLIGAEGGI